MIKLAAYAKLNLSLSILGLRQDGFHELESIVQTIDLADTITIEFIGRTLVVENNLAIPQDDDLVWRAANLVLADKKTKGVRIVVEKNIPAGAGLGGGSSDAAAVLWALDRFITPSMPKQHLVELARELGSDVPLFLTGGLMIISGRGERVSAFSEERPELFILLVPPIHCVTSAVYAQFDQSVRGRRKRSTPAILGQNELEQAALEIYPGLDLYREAITSMEADFSGLSGSGASYFGAFKNPAAAKVAYEELTRSCSEASVHLCSATESGYHLKEGC